MHRLGATVHHFTAFDSTPEGMNPKKRPNANLAPWCVYLQHNQSTAKLVLFIFKDVLI